MLSVVLATYNEEENIGSCLESIKSIADEIIIVDGSSTDKTAEIARKYGAKVVVTDNPPIFHLNKQKAVDLATKDWILQLDADERVDTGLAQEISKLVSGKIEDKISQENACDGYYINRKNYFLGHWLKKGGQYPDPVIRLFKKGKGKFPCKSVHEQIEIKGTIGTLKNDLLHYTAPTLTRYLTNNNRYAALTAKELSDKNLKINLLTAVNYLVIKPIFTFLLLFIRHKGFLDGYPGFIFAFYSGLLFAKAYLIYYKSTS